MVSRLGPSLRETVTTIADLAECDINVRVLEPALDTAKSTDKVVVNLMASLAEWERDLLIARTKESVAHARAQGNRRPTEGAHCRPDAPGACFARKRRERHGALALVRCFAPDDLSHAGTVIGHKDGRITPIVDHAPSRPDTHLCPGILFHPAYDKCVTPPRVRVPQHVVLS